MIKTLLLLTAVLCITAAPSYAQEKQKTVTIVANREPLNIVLGKVGEQAGVSFWDPIDKNILVTIKLINVPLEKALDSILKPHNYSWELNNTIVRIRKNELILSGKITTATGEPVIGANICIKGTKYQAVSDSAGKFMLPYNDTSDLLEVTSVQYKSLARKVGAERYIHLQTVHKVNTLEDVSVKGKVARPAADSLPSSPKPVTGSVVELNNVAWNASPVFDFTGRLDGNASGVFIPANVQPGQNQSSVNIRSKSTIEGNPQVLFLVDEMPYSSSLVNLNNDDMDSVRIYKDAAYTSPFGVFSGNGVIAIKSKEGRYQQKMSLAFNTTLTMGMKPDIYGLPMMSSRDVIGVEQLLYDHGFYNNVISNSNYTYLPQTAEIMHRATTGLIPHATRDSMLANLANTDVRKEAMRYLYRHSSHQHYHVSAAGGSKDQRYYASLGYDKSASSLVGNGFRRFTLNLNNIFALDKKGSELNVRVYYSNTETDNNGIDIGQLRKPYERLADDQGNPLAQSRNYRQQYIDTAGNGLLYDWKYRALDELKMGGKTIDNQALLFTTSLNYRLGRRIVANLSYRYEVERNERRNLYSEASYFTRDLNNQYSAIVNGVVTRFLPAGGIEDVNTVNNSVHNGSGRISYSYAKKAHVMDVYAGTEARQVKANSEVLRTYGYTEGIPRGTVDYLTHYPLFHSPLDRRPIPNIDSRSDTLYYFFSFFTAGSYTYKGRYTANFSVRKDESNIFGVKANQKGVPLWSVGATWNISQEGFFHRNLFSLLRLRASHGYCGNISWSASPLAKEYVMEQNNYGAPVGVIVSPPNPFLQWEQIGITNIGFDFSLLNNRITGTAEFYAKTGKYLFGLKPVDPTNGYAVFNGNVAAMKGRGVDITLNSKIIAHKYVEWSNAILVSWVGDKVTDYKVLKPAIGYYCNPETLNPLESYPLYSVFGFENRGLDSTGDPIGVLNGHESKDYDAIFQSRDFRNLKFFGSATPTFFGSFRNTFTWKKINLSINITYKGGYYFKRSTIRHADLVNGISTGHDDFVRRWQKPGDEAITDIPSFLLPVNVSRDNFFSNSSSVIEKGDHIRFKDLRLSYATGQLSWGRLKPSFEFLVYLNDLGIIWKANKEGLDPDYAHTTPNPSNITIGVKARF